MKKYEKINNRWGTSIAIVAITGVIGGLLVKFTNDYHDRMIDEYRKYLEKSWNLEERS